MTILKIRRLVLTLGAMLGVAPLVAWAADAASLQSFASYQEAKTWHEQFMQSEPTRAQRLAAMKALITASPVGSRGLNQIYHNFEGQYSIDPSITGLEKSVLMQLSASKQQAKGYRREVLYAVAYHNDPRFSVVEMNRPLKRSWGNTDADMVIRHGATGLSGRVEVKDYSLNSQRTNLAKLKVQIDKMSLEGKKTGQLQFWMNARPVIPEIQRYGERAGIYVSENVKTGKTIAPGSVSILEAMNQHEQQFFRANRQRVSIGAGELAFGAWKLKDAVPKLGEDLRDIEDPTLRSTNAWLRLGEDASSALAGTSMIVSGTAWTSARFASEASQPRLYSVGKVAGIGSVAALGIAEGFVIYRYIQGDALSQEFWTNQWVMGTSFVGGFVGGVAGYGIGRNPLAAFVGTSLGSYLGSEFGTRTAGRYYEYRFGEIDKAYGQWVYAKYAIR